jgi:hypothetical protein
MNFYDILNLFFIFKIYFLALWQRICKGIFDGSTHAHPYGHQGVHLRSLQQELCQKRFTEKPQEKRPS